MTPSASRCAGWRPSARCDTRKARRRGRASGTSSCHCGTRTRTLTFPKLRQTNPAGARQPAGQAGRDGPVHRLHRRRAADRPRREIYGNHLSLSKARAHRVALAMQENLGLPGSAIESDGRGASHPLASNETAQGRAMNRRIEVEFWYDDPLQELPDEPQLCPGRRRRNGDPGLRSRLGQYSATRARERSADHSARLRGEPASRARGHRGPDQCATAVYRLHEERASRPPHRVRVRRRHRTVRGAGAPRDGTS